MYLKDKKRNTTLGSIAPKLLLSTKTLRLGVTLNYPRTPTFLKMSSEQQRKLYGKIIHNVKNYLQILDESECIFSYETCQDGQIHLHCYLKYNLNEESIVIGCISDLAKLIHTYFPKYKKSNSFKTGSLYADYMRYRCPQMCIQHYEHEEDVETWTKYIKKYLKNS